MSIYHLSVKAISRSAGRSATAAAAYRSASKIPDQRTGLLFDFTHKSGVFHSEIILPAGSDWRPGRDELWNAAEMAERRKDACTAREHEIALPRELDPAQQLELVRAYCLDLSRRHCCAVDFAIHAPRPSAEHGKENWHVHVMQTTRKVLPGGELGEKCDREKSGRDRKADLQTERQRWEHFCNEALATAGLSVRIDHRSLDAQRQAAAESGDHETASRLNRQPTQHLGPAAAGIERRGRASRRRLDAREQEKGGGTDDEIKKLERELARLQRRLTRRQRRFALEPNRISGPGHGRPISLNWLHKEQRGKATLYRFPAGAPAVLDRGDSLSLPRQSDAALRAATSIAKEKGWKSVTVGGTDEFKKRSAAALLAAGLEISNPELQDWISKLKQAQTKQQPAIPTLANPFDLGRRAARLAVEIKQQEQARHKATRPDLDRAEAQLKQAIEGKQRRGKMEDSDNFRMLFAASICDNLERQALDFDSQAAAAQQLLAASQSGGRVARWLKRSQASRAAADIEKAKAEAARLRKRIREIETACRTMKNPKLREKYKSWALERIKKEKADAAALLKRQSALQKARADANTSACFDPERLSTLKRDSAEIETMAASFDAEDRERFTAGASGAPSFESWKRQEDERIEREKREEPERQKTADAQQANPSRPKGRGMSM